MPYSSNQLTEILEFASSSPTRPGHSRAEIERFVSELTSSPELIFDIHDGGTRVAVAVLIDLISNPSNSACLEMIGLSEPHAAIYETILSKAKARLPREKSGIEMGYFDDNPIGLNFFTDLGFAAFYTTYNMRRTTEIAPQTFEVKGYSWVICDTENIAAYHQVLSAAFAQNLEASIPPLDRVRLRFERRKNPLWLLRHGNQIVGFANVAIDDGTRDIGHVHTIGLLPELRGKGLGRMLLAKSIVELSGLGAARFDLTVAAANASALKLYEAFDFAVMSEDLCLRYKRTEL